VKKCKSPISIYSENMCRTDIICFQFLLSKFRSPDAHKGPATGHCISCTSIQMIYSVIFIRYNPIAFIKSLGNLRGFQNHPQHHEESKIGPAVTFIPQKMSLKLFKVRSHCKGDSGQYHMSYAFTL